MLILLIVILTFVLSLIGCKKAKKNAIKVALGVVAVLNILLICIASIYIYNTEYRINDIDSCVSSDGGYELLFQQVGDPDFPYGYTHARFVLMNDNEKVSKYTFDIANDGCSANPDLWDVSWNDNYVEAVISGEEQEDKTYILYYDGNVRVK